MLLYPKGAKMNMQTFRLPSFLLLLVTLTACGRIQPNSFEWRNILRESREAEAVQLHLREGLVDPDAEVAASQQLAKSLPVPVIESTESTEGKKVLKVLVDGGEKNYWDGRHAGGLIGTAAGIAGRRIGMGLLYSSPFFIVGLPFYNDGGFIIIVPGMGILGYSLYCAIFEGPILAIVDYADHKSFQKRYGYLPLQINGFATIKDEEIVFGGEKEKKYPQVPKRRYQLIDLSPAMKQIGQGENRDDEILGASLEAWIQALGSDLAKNKIGRKAKAAVAD
jgi:hypothetical protein